MVDTGLTEHTITRTGDRPLVFSAAKWWQVGDYEPAHDRWHRLAIYRTAGGKWVCECEYRTSWKDEHDHARAAVVDGPEEVAEWFRGIDPTEHYVGFPDTEAYAGKRRQAKLDIALRYALRVSELLELAGLVEEVE